MTVVVVVVVSASLVLGSTWGLYGRLPEAVEESLVALAGGALVVAVVSELVEPSLEDAPMWLVLGMLGVGAGVFVGLDHLVDEVWGASSGGGLLLAITLDGVPENLALGVTLISATPLEVAALAGSILLSNLPEAAGGSKQMADDGRSRPAVLGLWTATAVLLSAAALIGNYALTGASPGQLAGIRGFAGGAVIASLATEIFPRAYRRDLDIVGLAAALGLAIAIALGELDG